MTGPANRTSEDAAPLTRKQVVALQLLARGGARYGTMHEQMTQLRDMGLCRPHEKTGRSVGGRVVGRWTWRPTEAGRAVIAAKGIVARG